MGQSAQRCDSDRDVQAATWDNTRRRMISCLGEALITGCALKRLLNRFYNSVDQKNKRIATYIKNILEVIFIELSST